MDNLSICYQLLAQDVDLLSEVIVRRYGQQLNSHDVHNSIAARPGDVLHIRDAVHRDGARTIARDIGPVNHPPPPPPPAVLSGGPHLANDPFT